MNRFLDTETTGLPDGQQQPAPDDCQPEARACKDNVFMQVQQRPASMSLILAVLASPPPSEAAMSALT
jgi:hypothetical protein